MSARDDILNRMRKTIEKGPPVALPAAAPRVPVTRVDDASRPALRARFALELERVRGRLHAAANEAEARESLAKILRGCGAKRVAAWDDVPLTGWADTCAGLGVTRVGDDRADAATAPDPMALLLALVTLGALEHAGPVDPAERKAIMALFTLVPGDSPSP